MKKISIFLLTIFIVSLAACSDQDKQAQPTQQTESKENVIEFNELMEAKNEIVTIEDYGYLPTEQFTEKMKKEYADSFSYYEDWERERKTQFDANVLKITAGEKSQWFVKIGNWDNGAIMSFNDLKSLQSAIAEIKGKAEKATNPTTVMKYSSAGGVEVSCTVWKSKENTESRWMLMFGTDYEKSFETSTELEVFFDNAIKFIEQFK